MLSSQLSHLVKISRGSLLRSTSKIWTRLLLGQCVGLETIGGRGQLHVEGRTAGGLDN